MVITGKLGAFHPTKEITPENAILRTRVKS